MLEAAIRRCHRLGLAGIGDHRPLRRRGDGKAQPRADIRLVEAGQETVRFVRLEVGVDVLLAVHRIGEVMKTGAGAIKDVGVANPHCVALAQQGTVEHEPVRLPNRTGQLFAVDDELFNGLAGAVEEGALARRRVVELDRQVTGVFAATAGERERERVAHVADLRGADLGLTLRKAVGSLRIAVADHGGIEYIAASR